MNFRMIAKYLRTVFLLMMICMTAIFLMALVLREYLAAAGFFVTISICGFCMILLFFVQENKRALHIKDGFFVVSAVWIVLSLLGALPYWASQEIPDFLDALFESASGFTTTGATLVQNVEGMSRTILFWRSFTNWIGGMGVLIFVLALMSGTTQAGDQSFQVMRAEAPGPAPGKLVPKLRQSALILYLIYLALTVLEILLLFGGGMPLFDSVCNAMATAGTGGFSVRNQSIGAYGSVYCEVVVTVFMYLFGVNFNIFYFLLIRNFSAVVKSEEFRIYTCMMGLSILLVTCNLTGKVYPSFWQSLHYASFQVSSIMTTTGFGTANIEIWPTFSKALLLLLMFVGGSAGSTAGGIKVSRFIILFREIRRVLFSLAYPRSMEVVKMDGKVVDKTVVHSVTAYFATYVVLFSLSFLVVSWEGQEFTGTFSTVADCFSNVGRGFGGVLPACDISTFSPLSKLVLIADMLLGRLEIYPILLLFYRRTWRRI